MTAAGQRMRLEHHQFSPVDAFEICFPFQYPFVLHEDSSTLVQSVFGLYIDHTLLTSLS